MWRNRKNYGPSLPAIRSALSRIAVMIALVTSLIGVATALPTAANAQSCSGNSMLAEHSGDVRADNGLNELMFTTSLHAVWCYHNVIDGTVTGIESVTVAPDLTNLGAVGGWEYLGLVPGTSDGYYFNDSGAPDSGYHIFREAHWRLCLVHFGCISNAYIKMNMNVFFNGTAIFYTGLDHS